MKSENLNTKASNIRKLEQKSLKKNKIANFNILGNIDQIDAINKSGTDLDEHNILDILVIDI